MKTGWHALVVFALLAPLSQAAPPASLTGTWKVQSVTVAGKDYKDGVGLFAPGAVWKLKKNGRATLGDQNDWQWSYDADEGEFLCKRTVFFGWREDKNTFSVTSQGKDVKLKLYVLWRKLEVVLTPD